MFRRFQRLIRFEPKVKDPRTGTEGTYVAEYDGVVEMGSDSGVMFRNFRKHQLEKEKGRGSD
jgi:hypothetical protein